MKKITLDFEEVEKLRQIVQKIMANGNLAYDDYDTYRNCACKIVNKLGFTWKKK